MGQTWTYIRSHPKAPQNNTLSGRLTTTSEQDPTIIQVENSKGELGRNQTLLDGANTNLCC